MREQLWRGLVKTAAVVAALSAGSAWAAFGGMGPVDPGTGFPTWYEDTNPGHRVVPCVDGTAFCGVALPDPTQPAAVPGNFPVAAPYWKATATLNTTGGTALMTLSSEAGFFNNA